MTMLALNRLSRREGVALVERVAGDKPLPAEVVEEIVERTDGVPLFVEELTKAVLESGLPAQQSGPVCAHRAATAAGHPGDAARLADGASRPPSPAAKEVAQIGACIGREFSYELLSGGGAAAMTPNCRSRSISLSMPVWCSAGATPPQASLHVQARAGAGCGLCDVAARPAPGVARAHRGGSRRTLPDDGRAAAGTLGTPLHAGRPGRARRSPIG